MKGTFHTILITFLSFTVATGQTEDEDLALIQSHRNDILNATEDADRLRSNTQFKESLIRFIDNYGLDALVEDSLEKVGFVASHDKSVKFINWNVPFNNGTFQYEALLFEGKRNPTMHILQDDSDRMDRPAFAHGGGDHWFGALYYDIITSKNKDLGTYYLLLGWDGHTIESTKKVIDVLHFDKKKEPHFGAMVFGNPYQSNMRYLMEYTDEAIASLRYHPKEARIVFNNLIPPRPAMKGLHMFYVPSLSFDAFVEEDGKWLFEEDVEVRMNKSNDDAYLDPKRKKNKRKQRSIPNQK